MILSFGYENQQTLEGFGDQNALWSTSLSVPGLIGPTERVGL